MDFDKLSVIEKMAIMDITFKIHQLKGFIKGTGSQSIEELTDIVIELARKVASRLPEPV